ncbi:MAG TPA: AMP-binding protein, partial [Verrucomicrobiae bacterium]|nr:AMP-binding protein [Verrucomicrobiae bacterium]
MTTPRRNLQSFLGTMAECGDRGGFVRAGVRRHSKSYADVLRHAGGIRAVGLASGDRVLLFLEDGPSWVAAFSACLASGAVVVPLDRSSSAEFVGAVARRCGARILLYDGSAGAPPALPGVLAVDVEAVAPASSLGLIADPSPSDLAEIVFTSGTTAEPRGVMITHANILTALSGIERGIVSRRRLWSPFSPIPFVSLVPLSHLFGQALGLFIPSILGARVVYCGSRPPGALLALAKREKAWVLVSVPRHLAGIRAYLE